MSLPTISFSNHDVEQACLSDELAEKAQSLVRRNGCLLLENVFSPQLIEQLRKEYVSNYASYFEDIEHDDAATVGEKRFEITVQVTSSFNNPSLYANPLILPIIQKCLGADCLIGSFGSVTALPGAPQQHIHRDGALFGGVIDAMLPAFALTLMIPLVDLNELHGTTRMWKGTHVMATRETKDLPYVDPFPRTGSCMFMDYRLLHSGTPNQSSQVRPILYIVYTRPWFVDHRNFRKQAAIVINESEYLKVPEQARSLFASVPFANEFQSA